jgi:hypothetical protein
VTIEPDWQIATTCRRALMHDRRRRGKGKPMFKDLRMKERQKLWLTYRLSATEIHPYQDALASCTEDYARISSNIAARRSWPRSHDVIAIARTASGH